MPHRMVVFVAFLAVVLVGLASVGSTRADDLDSARVLIRRQKFAEARALLDSARPSARAAQRSDSLRRADFADLEAELAWRDRANMPERADSIGRAAVALREHLHAGASFEVAISLSHLGRIQRFSNQPDSALASLSRSVGILEHLPDRERELATGLVALGNLLKDRGEYLRSRDALSRAVEIRRRVLGATSREAAGALVNLALVDHHLGDRGTQTIHEREAIAIWERTDPPDSLNLFLTLVNHAGSLVLLRQESEALAVARRTDTLATKLHVRPQLQLQAVGNLARTLGDAGHPEEARRQFERGRAICAEGSRMPPDAEPVFWSEYGNFERQQGRLDSALVYTRRARGVIEALAAEDPVFLESLAQLQHEEGIVLASRGDFAAARRELEAAIASYVVRYPIEGVPDLTAARHDLVVARYWLGLRDSLLEFELAAERQRSRQLRRALDGLSEADALRYQSEVNDFSRYSLALAVDRPKSAPAESLWDQVIRSHAQVLDAMASRSRFIGSTRDSSLGPLARDIEHARAEESEALALTEPRRSQRLRMAHEHRLAAERALADRSPWFSRDLAREDVGFDDVARVLPANAALVQYVRFVRWDRARTEAAIADSVRRGGLASKAIDATAMPAWAAFVLRGGERTAKFAVLGSGEDIDRALAAWAAGLRAEATRPLLSPSALPVQAGRRVRRALWDSIAGLIAGAEVVLVVRDAGLHRVNLATLPGRDGRPLLETAPPFQVLTSPRDIISMESPAEAEGSLLAIGDPDFDRQQSGGDGRSVAMRTTRGAATDVSDCVLGGARRFVPLPATRSELDAVRRMCPSAFGEPVVLLGDAASRSAFLERAPRCRALHVATHGFFLRDTCLAVGEGGAPLLRVGLAFAGANRPGEGALVTAAEIASLRLEHTELAVLSACSSGAGNYVDGEGLFGMARAFALAGARTTVLSSNAVDDEIAALWMARFYQARWGSGASVAAATRDASLAVRREMLRRRLPDLPSQWGAFVATGDWR